MYFFEFYFFPYGDEKIRKLIFFCYFLAQMNSKNLPPRIRWLIVWSEDEPFKTPHNISYSVNAVTLWFFHCERYHSVNSFQFIHFITYSARKILFNALSLWFRNFLQFCTTAWEQKWNSTGAEEDETSVHTISANHNETKRLPTTCLK